MTKWVFESPSLYLEWKQIIPSCSQFVFSETAAALINIPALTWKVPFPAIPPSVKTQSDQTTLCSPKLKVINVSAAAINTTAIADRVVPLNKIKKETRTATPWGGSTTEFTFKMHLLDCSSLK